MFGRTGLGELTNIAKTNKEQDDVEKYDCPRPKCTRHPEEKETCNSDPQRINLLNELGHMNIRVQITIEPRFEQVSILAFWEASTRESISQSSGYWYTTF